MITNRERLEWLINNSLAFREGYSSIVFVADDEFALVSKDERPTGSNQDFIDKVIRAIDDKIESTQRNLVKS